MEFINANDLPAAGTMATDNKVIVQQGDKFVLMTLAELLEYVASASVETDPTLTLEGVAAEALATGKAVKAARAVNLLDNSDFTNLINQRGKSTYTGGGTHIDRWGMYSNSNMTVTVEDGGIILDNTKETTGPTNVYHRFNEDMTARISGKVVTIAACDENDNILVGSGTLTAENVSSNTAQFTAESDDGTMYINIYKRASTQLLEFRINMNAGQKKKIKWAALYEGEYTAETLPEYQPKGYAAELAECQRYYLPLYNYLRIRATRVLSHQILFTIPVPVTMRTTPTLADPSGILSVVNVAGTTEKTGFTYAVTAVHGNAVQIEAKLSAHGLSDGFISFNTNDVAAAAYLSADL